MSATYEALARSGSNVVLLKCVQLISEVFPCDWYTLKTLMTYFAELPNAPEFLASRKVFEPEIFTLKLTPPRILLCQPEIIEYVCVNSDVTLF